MLTRLRLSQTQHETSEGVAKEGNQCTSAKAQVAPNADNTRLAFDRFQKREDEMRAAFAITAPVYKTVYEPETLQVMGAAFDRAWKFLSTKVAASEINRRKLALRIIMHVDGGENHPTRLAALAITDFLRYPG
jgi:hypothetical protein